MNTMSVPQLYNHAHGSPVISTARRRGPLKTRRADWTTPILLFLMCMIAGMLVLKVHYFRMNSGAPRMKIETTANGTALLDFDGLKRTIKWENNTEAGLNCAVVSPEQGLPHLATVIYAPGLAQSVAYNPMPARLAQQWPNIRWVTMQEPKRLVTVRKKFMNEDSTYAWFNMLDMPYDYDQDQDVANMRDSARRISLVIKSEQEILVQSLRSANRRLNDPSPPSVDELEEASKRIVLAGFSQGGAMTLLAGLPYPQQLGGLVVLSSFLPMRSSLPSMVAPLNRQDLPIFMAHGDRDPYLLVDDAVRSRDIMTDKKTGLGLKNVEFKTFHKLGHATSNDEVDAVSSWMKRNVFNNENRMLRQGSSGKWQR